MKGDSMSSKKEMLANIVNALKGTSWGEKFMETDPVIDGKPLEKEEPKEGVEHPRAWYRLGVFFSHANVAGIQQNCPKEQLSPRYEMIAKFLLDNPTCTKEQWENWMSDHKSELACHLDRTSSTPRTPKPTKGSEEFNTLVAKLATARSKVKKWQKGLEEAKESKLPKDSTIYTMLLNELTTARAELAELETQFGEAYSDEIVQHEIESFEKEVAIFESAAKEADRYRKLYLEALDRAEKAHQRSLDDNAEFESRNGMSIAQHTAKYGYDIDSKTFYELPQKGQEK